MLIATVLALSEAIVRHYPNSYRFKAEWMDRNGQRVKTLILGESHTYYAIVPNILGDSVFNLANVSQLPEYDYWLLDKSMEHCRDLKTVIMPVDEINMFDLPLEDNEEWHRCIYYHIYMGYPKHDYNPLYSFELCNIATFNMKLGPAIRYMLTGKDDLDCDSTGFGCTFDTPASFNEENMRSTAKATYEHNKNETSSNYNAKYLYKIAKLCHERGIKLVLVTTPVWQEYKNLFGKHRYDEMHKITHRCVKEYETKYLDYIDDPRFQGVDFHDASHLSRQGAEKFTKILKQDLNQ